MQARLLPMALTATTLSMAFRQVRSGGVAILRWFLACLQASFLALLTLFLPLCRWGRGNCLPTQSQVSYHSTSSSPSARHPSSGFDSVNEEADVRTKPMSILP